MDLKNILSVEEVSISLSKNAIARTEIPNEWELSLPMPTLQFQRPAFFWFACPAERHPHRPLRLFPPDRWFALDAFTSKLLYFNAWEPPLKNNFEKWHAIDLPISELTREETKKEFDILINGLNLLTFSYFNNQPINISIFHLLIDYLDPQTIPWYRNLAPDFWNWLEKKP